MTHPQRLQRRRSSPAYVAADGRAAVKGDDGRYSLDGMPVVYVGRPTKWGNPFDTAEEYREWAISNQDRLFYAARFWGAGPYSSNHSFRLQEIFAIALSGKNLACWCRPDHECHADVLLELANGGTI